MRTGQLQNSRAFIAISLVAVLFVLAAACGGEVANTAASGAASDPSTEADPVKTASTIQPAAEPTEPPLINTPVPVANSAPDFTLPSIQGVDYTLSQFRGERPVAIVFYRAYW